MHKLNWEVNERERLGFRSLSNFPGKARPFQERNWKNSKGERKRVQPWQSRESSPKSPKAEVLALVRHQCRRWGCRERTGKSQVTKRSRLRGTISESKESIQGKLSLKTLQGCSAPVPANFSFKLKKKSLRKIWLKQDGCRLFSPINKVEKLVVQSWCSSPTMSSVSQPYSFRCQQL